MAVNAKTEKFQHIEVFDKPALFTNGRIARDTVPKGWYRRREQTHRRYGKLPQAV